MAVFQAGEHSPVELADLFCVGRSTVYRIIGRQRAKTLAVPVDTITV